VITDNITVNINKNDPTWSTTIPTYDVSFGTSPLVQFDLSGFVTDTIPLDNHSYDISTNASYGNVVLNNSILTYTNTTYPNTVDNKDNAVIGVKSSFTTDFVYTTIDFHVNRDILQISNGTSRTDSYVMATESSLSVNIFDMLNFSDSYVSIYNPSILGNILSHNNLSKSDGIITINSDLSGGSVELNYTITDTITDTIISSNTVTYIINIDIKEVKYRHAAGSIPIGCIIPHISSNPPSAGFLKCDGSSYSKLEYKALFNVIGYIYGGVDTSFNVPNMMNRKPYMSSSKKLNQTNNATVSNETNMRALDINNLPKHGHNISNVEITHSHIGSGNQIYLESNSHSNVAGNQESGKTTHERANANFNGTSGQNSTNNIKMNISNDTSGTPFDVENNWCNLYYYIRCI